MSFYPRFLKIGGTVLDATAAELDVLDGVTAGTATASKAVILDASSKIDALDITALTLNGTSVDATATEINNTVDGATATAAELNTLTDDSNADALHEHSIFKWTDTADADVEAYRLVELDASGDLIEATVDSYTVMGANADNATASSAASIDVANGKTTVVAAAPVVAGYPIKAADNGRVVRYIDTNFADSTIDDGSGGGFANQPANDTVEVVSDAAGDTTQTATIIGTTNGGNVVVVESVSLNGTSAVATTKADWGEVLAVKLDASCAGTVTIQEQSGGLAITTITTGNTDAGVVSVPAADQGASNAIPNVVADSGTTKNAGIQYTQTDGTTVAYQCADLNGATDVAYGTAALLVTELYVGDVESARTATVKVSSTQDDEDLKVGRVFADANSGSVAAIVYP